MLSPRGRLRPAEADDAGPYGDVDGAGRGISGPVRIAVPVSPEAALRAVADSALAEAMGGAVEVHRVGADIRELSRYVGVGFAAGAVAGLLVGAVVEDKNGLYAAPLLILYVAGGATVGMATGAVAYYARGGRT